MRNFKLQKWRIYPISRIDSRILQIIFKRQKFDKFMIILFERLK